MFGLMDCELIWKAPRECTINIVLYYEGQGWLWVQFMLHGTHHDLFCSICSVQKTGQGTGSSFWPPFLPLRPLPRIFEGLLRPIHCKRLHGILFAIFQKVLRISVVMCLLFAFPLIVEWMDWLTNCCISFSLLLLLFYYRRFKTAAVSLTRSCTCPLTWFDSHWKPNSSTRKRWECQKNN